MLLKLGAPQTRASCACWRTKTLPEAEYRFEPFVPDTPPSGAKLLKECTEEML